MLHGPNLRATVERLASSITFHYSGSRCQGTEDAQSSAGVGTCGYGLRITRAGGVVVNRRGDRYSTGLQRHQ